MKRQALADHVAHDCPYAEIECDYVEIGCTKKMLRLEREEHMEQANKSHMKMMQQKMQKLNEEVVTLKGKVNALEIRRQEGPAVISHLEERLAAFHDYAIPMCQQATATLEEGWRHCRADAFTWIMKGIFVLVLASILSVALPCFVRFLLFMISCYKFCSLSCASDKSTDPNNNNTLGQTRRGCCRRPWSRKRWAVLGVALFLSWC